MIETCILFTSNFPYGTTESFLENEIKYLAESFKQVFVLPMNSGGQMRSLPNNVYTIDLFTTYAYSISNSIKYGGLRLFTNLSVDVLHLVKCSLSRSSFISLFSLYLRLNDKANVVEEWFTTVQNCVLYSYWLDEWATILAILKSKGLINTFHARIHGFDLYEDRHEYGFIPFRKLQLKQVTTVSAVSKAGYEYMNEKYPVYSEKFLLHHLGVQDNGMAPFKLRNNFTLVSCSNVIPLKRVELIVDILRNIKLPVEWIHFGDGIQLETIKKLASSLPENIKAEFKGRITNQDIVEFYKSEQVDLFITTTETEGGCPVSLQEAISFGIPVIGTAVGGVPEVINNKTGFLIRKDFDSVEVASKIQGFLTSEHHSAKFRKSVRSYWEKEFVAKTNFERYINQVLLSNS